MENSPARDSSDAQSLIATAVHLETAIRKWMGASPHVHQALHLVVGHAVRATARLRKRAPCGEVVKNEKTFKVQANECCSR